MDHIVTESVDRLVFFWAVPLGIFLVVAGVRWFVGRRRHRAIAEAAGSIGFFPGEESSVDVAEMHLLSLGNGGSEYKNVLKGSAAGHQTAIFDYVYSEGSGRSEHDVSQTVAAFHLPGANMPDFQIFPRSLLRTFTRPFHSSEFDFKSNPEFAKRYVVTGADEIQARAFLTPGILSFLAARPENAFHIEGYYDWIIVYKPSSTVAVAKLRDFVDQTSALASGILSQTPRPLLWQS